MSNTTTSGVTETFASLSSTGTAVSDFAGGDVSSPGCLYRSALNNRPNSKLLVQNCHKFTDFLRIDSSSSDTTHGGLLSRIEFEGHADKIYSSTHGTGWNQIRPVPEPSTYGLIKMSGGLAFYSVRRWCQSKTPAKAKVKNRPPSPAVLTIA